MCYSSAGKCARQLLSTGCIPHPHDWVSSCHTSGIPLRQANKSKCGLSEHNTQVCHTRAAAHSCVLVARRDRGSTPRSRHSVSLTGKSRPFFLMLMLRMLRESGVSGVDGLGWAWGCTAKLLVVTYVHVSVKQKVATQVHDDKRTV